MTKEQAAESGGAIEVVITSELPVGSGLGSSAAWGASLSASFFHAIYFIIHGKRFTDKDAEKEHVWSYTNLTEYYFHGKPSGCDAAITIHGDIMYYRKGIPPELTEIKPLPMCKVENLNMILVNTNAKKDTKKLVASVTEMKKADPAQFDELMNTLRDVTSEIIELL